MLFGTPSKTKCVLSYDWSEILAHISSQLILKTLELSFERSRIVIPSITTETYIARSLQYLVTSLAD